MAEFDILSKDYIKLNFLSEIVNTKAVSMNVYLEIDGVEKDFLDVRTAEKNAYRFNNFNVSEDASSNCLTFRPVVIGCLAYFKIISNQTLRIEIVKNGTNSVAQSFDISAGETKIEFDPQGTSKYVMKVNQISVSEAIESPTSVPKPEVQQSSNPFESEFSGFNVAPIPVAQSTDNSINSVSNNTPVAIPPQPAVIPEVLVQPSFSTVSREEVRVKQNELNDLQHSESRLNTEISELNDKIVELNDKIQKLTDNKRHLVENMDKLQAEYNKNYSNYEQDFEEIKSKYDIDEEILLMYADREVVPIEELIERAKFDINQLEEQIRIFIEAQARKTAEIENELKIGKKE
ncbi:MAG: hypothetical protein K2G45_02380 [Lachnospiraceae bacterium]|nr:hypothetical protein [Lachnospiraceae bacterium]